MLINVLKLVGIVKDGTSQKWSLGLNLIGIVLMASFRVFYPHIVMEELDPMIADLATITTMILTFVSQLGISKLTNEIVRGSPIIGKSYSQDKIDAFFLEYTGTIPKTALP